MIQISKLKLKFYYLEAFLAICILKFLGKLEQLDLAESCFEFPRPLVNTSIEQPISPHVPQLLY